MASAASARARHNVLLRYRSPDDPAVVEARRDLRAAQAEEYIKKLVDAAPPLSPQQLDKLALLLRRPSDCGGAAA